jgi:hypothetical protein
MLSRWTEPEELNNHAAESQTRAAHVSEPAEPIARLMNRTGLAVMPLDFRRLLWSGKLTVNGERSTRNTLVRAGDTVAINGQPYLAEQAGVRGRLYLSSNREMQCPRKTGPVRVHCGFHKCLTMYSRRTYGAALRFTVQRPRGFHHFYHRVDGFYDQCEDFRVTSVSGHVLDLDRFDDIRVVRFIRDPRDLIISGYFYHKRGAEDWCLLEDPVDADWAMVYGKVPAALSPGMSLTGYLEGASRDEGLAAEYEFRRFHFDAMRDWPADSARVRTYRYEDIMGRERETFEEIFGFFGLRPLARRLGLRYADRHSAGNARRKSRHIRNEKSGQWRDLLPAVLAGRMAEEYGDMLERYGYPRR